MTANDGEAFIRRGPIPMDPALDQFRLPATDRCWWCGDLATTEEHRIKHSTLRRVARTDTGAVDPSTVFKSGNDYEGVLRTLRKGSQVRWRKNLCAKCNNERSQPFDQAHDLMETFVVDHVDQMIDWERLPWDAVYGTEWATGSRNLARYFGKQVGCMLASQRLPVPDDLITFLNGAERCPSVCFAISMNWRAANVHQMLVRDGIADGITTFVGLLEAPRYLTDGQLTGLCYGYHIGYVWFRAEWLAGTDRASWWEYPEIDLHVVNGDLRSRAGWRARLLRSRATAFSRRLGLSPEHS